MSRRELLMLWSFANQRVVLKTEPHRGALHRYPFWSVQNLWSQPTHNREKKTNAIRGRREKHSSFYVLSQRRPEAITKRRKREKRHTKNPWHEIEILKGKKLLFFSLGRGYSPERKAAKNSAWRSENVSLGAVTQTLWMAGLHRRRTKYPGSS